MQITPVFLVFVAVLSVAAATQFDWSIVDKVNADESSLFVAGINENFGKHASVESIKHMLGYKPKPLSKRLPVWAAPKTSIPTSWSAVTAYPDCPSCSAIQNQGECGSCWAFGAVGSFTDRLCIHTNTTCYVQLSDQELTSCARACDGCQGCDAGSAYQYIQQTGLVTGGQTPIQSSKPVATPKGSGMGIPDCYPYTQPTCTPAQQPCLPNTFKPTLPCTLASLNATCRGNAYKAAKIYTVPSNFNGHAQELFQNGPIEMCFNVYENFVGYKSGIYNKASGSLLGGHCVRCSGYGVSSGTQYLQCLNSWTPTWGDNGQFLIKFGIAGAGSDSVAGMPDTTGLI